MNAIIGFAALLTEPNIDYKSREAYTDVIIQSSNHLLAIIMDIVDISNIEANLVKFSKSEINLNAKLKPLCDQFNLKASEQKLEFKCDNALGYS